MHIDYLSGVKKNWMGRFGLGVLLILVMIVLCTPFLPLQSPYEPSENTLSRPSADHWLGTNEIGQDIFSRVVHAAGTTLAMALLTGIYTTTLSLILGGASVLAGGMAERLSMRLADILLTLPHIIIVIIVAAYVRPGVGLLSLLLAVISWPAGARIIRSQTLSLINRNHIYAARTFGAGGIYILSRHIIPDLIPVIVVTFIQTARMAIFMEAGLSFLGALDPTLISWGMMLNRALGFSYLGVWHWLLPPGLALSLTILALTLVGYFLEEILNPRLQVNRFAGNQ